MSATTNFFGTKVGIAVLTFLLGIGGTIVTAAVAAYEHQRDSRTAVMHERVHELTSLHDGLERTIMQREIATDDVINAYKFGTTAEEIEQIWRRYLDASRTESLSELQSHLIIQGHTNDDLDIGHITGMEQFWYFLDTVIQPRFESIHNCLLQVRSDFINAAPPIANQFARGRETLGKCENDGGWDKKAYYNSDTKRFVAITLWGHAKSCMEDYVFFVDLNTRFLRRVWQEDSSGSFFSRFLSAGSKDGETCEPDNVRCFQVRFLKNLKTTLESSCGIAERGYQ